MKQRGASAQSVRRSARIGKAPSERPESVPFPVVGIGASAGGLEAVTKLLYKLPPDTGMALVFVQHLDPRKDSILASLLSRSTSMPVHEVTSRMTVEPNHVYVISRDTKLRIQDSTLRLTRPANGPSRQMPIDAFFESLAASQKSKAIGVVLSGAASDGTAGLRQIKSEGGITFAQDLGSARFDGMPRNAIAAGVVDFVLPPEDIAGELAQISRNTAVTACCADTAVLQADRPRQTAGGRRYPQNVTPHVNGRRREPLKPGKDDLDEIFGLLRAETGSDFSSCKSDAFEPIVRRRMLGSDIDKFSDYARLLQQNAAEAAALREDLLFSSAEFFRYPQAFDTLKTEIFPKLLAKRPLNAPIRVWAPACSTGEEVYSLAITLLDFLSGRQDRYPVQIFVTDINDAAILKARYGSYPENVTATVAPDLLRRYFTKTEHGYRIVKRVHDLCIFARHDLLKDPPFSRLDLISCSDLFFRLGRELQDKALRIFHYALQPNGYLLLGKSESAWASPLFAPVDNNSNIYVKKSSPGLAPMVFPLHYPEKPMLSAHCESPAELDLQTAADRVVVARYGPPAIIIDERMEIVHFRGDISPYLQPIRSVAGGPLAADGIRKRTPGLVNSRCGALRDDVLKIVYAAVNRAMRGTGPVCLPLKTSRLRGRNLIVQVLPLPAPPKNGRFFLVLFETASRAAAPVARAAPRIRSGTTAAREIEQLRQELAEAGERLRISIDERRASEEKLQSANEEILSSNEELQSTNEALEVSQEELQVTNEELSKVNNELHDRNFDLRQLTNDLRNLLVSVNIPIVMLDNHLRVRHFTQPAARLLHLNQSDIGHPIADVRSNLEIPDLEKILARVIEDLTPREMEIQDRAGAWYSMRIRPYRTQDNEISGAVMILYDVNQLKRSLEEVRQARDFSQAIVETIPEPLVILDADLRVIMANRTFYDTFRLPREETEGKRFPELSNSGWDFTAMRDRLYEAFQENREFDPLGIEAELPRSGHRSFLAAGRLIDLGADQRRALLLALSDVTEQKLAESQMQSARSTLEKNLRDTESSLRESEADLRRSREELRDLAARLLTTQEAERRRVSRELHDDLNQKLAMLEMDADRLGAQIAPTPEIGRELQSLRNRVADLSNDIRRVAYELHPSILEHLGLGVALRSYCNEFSKREGIKVKFSVKDQPESVPDDVALCLYRITQEGLRNVGKHASAKSASVALEMCGSRLHLCIRDNGGGFEPGAKHKGGIGLLSMKERVRLVDGEFMLQSNLGKGTRLDVWAPLSKGPE